MLCCAHRSVFSSSILLQQMGTNSDSLQLITAYQGKMVSTGSLTGKQSILKGRPMSSGRWPTRNKLSGIFGGSLSNNTVTGRFSNLTGPLHASDCSWFYIFLGFLCVNMCFFSLCEHVSPVCGYVHALCSHAFSLAPSSVCFVLF